MVQILNALQYQFVVPGRAISFRSSKAKLYKAAVARAAKPVLPGVPTDVPIEVRLDYFHMSPRRFDMDNVAKCVLDALNDRAYTDDRLVRLQSSKAHDITKRVDIRGGPVDLVKPLRLHRDYLFVRIRVAG